MRTFFTFVSCTGLLVGIFASSFAPIAEAVVLNNDAFEASGGDATDAASVAATLDAGYADARAYSFEEQFLAVGNISGCTATWIGNDSNSDSSFFLTAAHCIEGQSPGGVGSFSITNSFTDWDGNSTGSLSGTAYLPPERYDSANFGCGGGACSDVAIIELPGQIDIRNATNAPVIQPLIYDGDREQGFENSFVGYGSWGVGTMGSDGGLFPSTGPRRAGATNIINGFFESNKGIGTDFDAPGTDNARPDESAVASGDSGSAWWQEHLGHWTIIATTNGGSGNTYGAGSTGARTSQYTDWIQSVFPGVQLWSENVLIGDINLDGVVDADLSGDDDFTAFISAWRNPSTPGNITIADLNEDQIVDFADFYLFRQAVIEAGGGAISASALSGVPEPSSMLLIVISLFTGTFLFKRK